MKIKLSKLPPRILEDIKQSYGRSSLWGPDMDLEQALNAYLSWNGIIGYTKSIMEIIKAAK